VERERPENSAARAGLVISPQSMVAIDTMDVSANAEFSVYNTSGRSGAMSRKCY